MTATEAGQTFLRLLEEVKKGHTIMITRYGKPAARIVPPKPAVPETTR